MRCCRRLELLLFVVYRIDIWPLGFLLLVQGALVGRQLLLRHVDALRAVHWVRYVKVGRHRLVNRLHLSIWILSVQVVFGLLGCVR